MCLKLYKELLNSIKKQPTKQPNWTVGKRSKSTNHQKRYIANKHMKGLSTLYVIIDCKIRHWDHYTCIRMAGKKTPENNIKYRQGTLIHCLGRPQMGTTILENSLTLTTKTKNTLQHGQNILLLIFLSNRNITPRDMYKNVYSSLVSNGHKVDT